MTMSRRRNYHQDTLDVMSRFFLCLDSLVKEKKVSMSGFCADNDIDKRHLYAQRKDPYRGYFESHWLTTLVRKYGASPDYLLTGSGAMFRG